MAGVAARGGRRLSRAAHRGSCTVAEADPGAGASHDVGGSPRVCNLHARRRAVNTPSWDYSAQVRGGHVVALAWTSEREASPSGLIGEGVRAELEADDLGEGTLPALELNRRA
jgi:hypothetical protein